MPRLIHSRTGVVVNVDDVTAATLGPEWSAPKAPAKPAAKPRK